MASQNGMRILPILLGLALTAWRPAAAANRWDGEGGDDHWNTPENWDDNAVPAFPVALVFDGTQRLAPTNDLTAVTVNGITFSSTAGAFVIGGNAITLGGTILNESALLQTVNLDMALNAVRTVSPGAGGGNIRLGGVLSGTGGLAVTGSGTLTLSGDNRLSGDTTLGAGGVEASVSLHLAHPNALGTGKLSLANTSGQSLSLDNASGQALTITNHFDMPTSILLTFWGSQDLTIGGQTTLRASGPKIFVAAGRLTLNRIDAALASQAFGKYGPGALAIAGAAGPTFQGGLTLGEGTLILGHPAAMGSGTFTVANGVVGTLQASADLTGANRVNNPMGNLLGAITVSGTNNLELGAKIARTATTSDMKLNSDLPAGKAFTINDVDINLSATSRLLIFDGTGEILAKGVIGNGHASTANGLTKNGTGRLSLMGDNAYRGNTTLNAGTLVAGHSNACGTVGSITVKTNALFAVNAGVAFTRPVTFNNGSALGGGGTLVRGGAWSLPTSFAVKPGLSTNATETLSVDTAGGTLAFGNNTLEIDFAGRGSDRLALAGGGALDLGGAADRLVLRGRAHPGTHVLASAAAVNGVFGTEDLSALSPAGARVVYQADRVLLVAGEPGTVVVLR